jgi:putative spermidine/putrescine transport system substrate-binding protein
VIREYGRAVYDKWIAALPIETPLTPERLVAAFRRWDEQIGSKASK